MMRKASVSGAVRPARVLCSGRTAIVAYSRRNAKRKMVDEGAEGEERFLASLGMTDGHARNVGRICNPKARPHAIAIFDCG
jgi:hypothetical protein